MNLRAYQNGRISCYPGIDSFSISEDCMYVARACTPTASVNTASQFELTSIFDTYPGQLGLASILLQRRKQKLDIDTSTLGCTFKFAGQLSS